MTCECRYDLPPLDLTSEADYWQIVRRAVAVRDALMRADRFTDDPDDEEQWEYFAKLCDAYMSPETVLVHTRNSDCIEPTGVEKEEIDGLLNHLADICFWFDMLDVTRKADEKESAR